MNPKHQHVSKDNRAAKHSLKQLQNAMKRLEKMGVVVVSYYHHEMHQKPVITALHNDATAGLVMLGKAKQTNQGVDATGQYAIYGMMLNNIYLRFTVRPD